MKYTPIELGRTETMTDHEETGKTYILEENIDNSNGREIREVSARLKHRTLSKSHEYVPQSGPKLNSSPHGLDFTSSNDLFEGLDTDIENVTPEQLQYLVKRAFCHYAICNQAPCVWIPRDQLGICQEQVNDIRLNYPFIRVSCEACSIDTSCKIDFHHAPPDFDPTLLMKL